MFHSVFSPLTAGGCFKEEALPPHATRDRVVRRVCGFRLTPLSSNMDAAVFGVSLCFPLCACSVLSAADITSSRFIMCPMPCPAFDGRASWGVSHRRRHARRTSTLKRRSVPSKTGELVCSLLCRCCCCCCLFLVLVSAAAHTLPSPFAAIAVVIGADLTDDIAPNFRNGRQSKQDRNQPLPAP